VKAYILLLPLAMVALLATASLQNFAHAHGGAGQSVEKIVGEYLVTLEYSELSLTADESVRFTFELSLNEAAENVPFTDIWVRIMEGNKLLFAGLIKEADFSPTGISYAFPKGGEYELTARFQNEGEAIAETSFPLTVEESEQASGGDRGFSIFLFGIPVAGLIGLAIGLLFSSMRRRDVQPIKPTNT